MPVKENTLSDPFDYQREMAGRYEVYLVSPRIRLGHLLGKPGHWCAENTQGKQISCFSTRKDGANALLQLAGHKSRP